MAQPFPCASCQTKNLIEGAFVGKEFNCFECGAGTRINRVPPQFNLAAFARGALPFLVVGGGAAVLKGVQIATDSWEGAGGDSLEFSATFKRWLKEQHVEKYGLVCLRCDRRVRSYADLHVDHIKSIRDGGEPWRSNAQILCNRCNLAKGPNSSFYERMRGR